MTGTATRITTGAADGLSAISTERGVSHLTVRNEYLNVEFGLDAPEVRLGSELVLRCHPAVPGEEPTESEVDVVESGESLVRVRHSGRLGQAFRFRITFDVFQSRNVHVYARLEATAPVVVDSIELPRIALETAGLDVRPHGAPAGRRWLRLTGDTGALGVVVKKLPWKASWNDIGCHDHWSLADSRLAVSADPAAVALVTDRPLQLAAGDTVEAALFLTLAADEERLRAEGTHELPDEVRYVPEGEHMHSLVWETEDLWLGPPITEGSPQRPYDQLIPRPAGLNVLARKRFNWNNEDFGLYRLTGKDSYWESGIKKAHALLATQNEYGGWFEGIEFYNLPPRHHQMYDTYIGGLFLLEAYDATGSEAFLEGARRCQGFWLGDPPANGHTKVGDGGWWYRWGGYINEFGYTDERHVLNTHAGATAFLALLYERTGERTSLEAVERGMAAFRWGLQQGIQRGDGQFLYCLSQVDPTLELPGDPPYLKLELVPQIEDVYTIASSYRLMLANRVVRDAEVMASLKRALAFWWGGYRAGTTITYRAYATIAFGLAAGEIDPVYALALPELLKDREHFTSMQRGMSSFIAPAGLPRLKVSVDGFNGSLVEPVFVKQEEGRLTFALVNLEYRQRGLRATVTLPPGRSGTAARIVDPATREATELEALEHGNGVAHLVVPELGEFGVVLIELEF